MAGAKLENELNMKLSSRYHGLPEANHSNYVIMEAAQGGGAGEDDGDNGNDNDDARPKGINIISMHGYTNFTQPAKFQRLSMQQAEQAISSQNLTRYMMHQNGTSTDTPMAMPMHHNNHNHNNNHHADASKPKARSRLLHKLAAGDEDNDVMADLCFREAKSSSKSFNNSELLKGIGDADVKMDADGILGGAHDAEFGGKRRFGRMGSAAGIKQEEENNKKKKQDGNGDEHGNDVAGEAVAMQDDFYQRDVGAEYDELDYDPNEQFDDDDVDVGAEEVDMEDAGGFAADIDDSDDDDDDGEEDGDDFDLSGWGSGFATSAGMKAMIAKANGEEVQPPVAAVPPITPLDGNGKQTSSSSTRMSDTNATSGSDRSDDELLPTRTTDAASANQNTAGAAGITTTASGVQLDENGLRVITKEAVRREIWLHNGSMEMRKLAKVYKVSGKSVKDRQEKFKSICKELCNMSNGMLILKQHYSKMD